MSTEKLEKSIDELIEDVFGEEVVKSEEIYHYSDSKTTADAVMSEVPSSEKDESRGAGRPKQISDVPQKDQDGRRASEYDASISEDESDKGEEPEETKKQSQPMDQSIDAHRFAASPKMKDPRLSKSISEEEYAEFEAFKKAQVEAKETAKKEELKKAEELRKVEAESLVKAAVEKALSPIKKENEELKKSILEQNTLIKAMASQPQRAKSVTGIDVLEKSKEEVRGQESVSKAEKLDAAEELFKAGQIPMEAIVELDNTGTIYNPEHRRLIEKKLGY